MKRHVTFPTAAKLSYHEPQSAVDMGTEATRRDLLLAFVAAADTPVDPIRIMKGMFLIAQEGGVKPEQRYDFVPYSYGPCSFRIYDDLDCLVDAGLIERRASGARWATYVASKNGRDLSQKFGHRIGSVAGKYRKYVSSLSFNKLLRDVYAKYPEFARNSVFRT